MKLLIDTSNGHLILSLINNDYSIIEFYKEESKRELTKITNSRLEAFLGKYNLKLNNITELYVVAGPGSFTGIKISVVIANTMKSLNPSLKLYTLSSLEFMKKSIMDVTAIDARGGKYFFKTPYRIKMISSKKVKEDWITDYSNVDEENVIYNIRRFRITGKIKPLYKKGVL